MAKPLIALSELESISPIFKGKAGRALSRALFHIFGIDKVQKLYDDAYCEDPADCAGRLVSGLDLKYTVQGEEHLSSLPQGPFITISNHPIGSLDGVIMVDYMRHRFPDYKLLVNQVLMRIEALRPSFISVVPTLEERTAPKAESVSGIRAAKEHLMAGHPLGLFPSGAVSDYVRGKRPTVTLADGTSYVEPQVRDRQWQMPIIKFIRKAEVPVLPIRFFDGNSPSFYRIGNTLGWKVRTLRLPHELMNKRGGCIRMGVGPLISVERQNACRTLDELRQMLRAAVYSQQLKD